MTVESRMGFFARSALVALAYGLAYGALRAINHSSISHINWIPMAALRFICLLFVPARYWPALVAGELVPIVYQNYLCLDRLGWAWMLTGSVPPLTYAAAIIHFVRKHAPDFEKRVSQNIGCLLLCMFAVSLCVGVLDMLNYSLATTLAPGEKPIPLGTYGMRRVTGNYLTILTITPVALWLAAGLQHTTVSKRLRLDAVIGALKDIHWRVTGLLLAATALLTGLGYWIGETVHIFVLGGILAMLFVAAWRCGWQSAALVGAVANLGVVALMPTRDDSLTIIAQGMIAAFMTCALLLGARTTAAREFARALRLAEQKAAATRELARQEMFSHERHRLAYATMLNQVFDKTRQEATRVLHDVRAALPSGAIAKHYREFDELYQSHERLTNGLSPRALIKLGGPDGPIVRALEALGARCKIDLPSPISDLMRLSTALSIAIYRISCEAVAYLVKHAPSDDIRIALTVHGKEGERPVAEITLESLGRALTMESAAYTSFRLRMSAIGLSKRALERRAQLYEGHMEIERLSDLHLRMRFRVTETDESASQMID